MSVLTTVPKVAQFAGARELERAGQHHHAVQELVQGFGLDEIGPAQQRGIVGDWLQIEAAERAQDETVADVVLGLLVAEAVEVLDDQQAQDDLNRGGGTPVAAGARKAAAQVGFDQMKQAIVLEQVV
jgi:hypothetical protein